MRMTGSIPWSDLADIVLVSIPVGGGGQSLSRTVSRHVGDELVKTKRRASLSDKLVGTSPSLKLLVET